jgi:hypothetical protein
VLGPGLLQEREAKRVIYLYNQEFAFFGDIRAAGRDLG